MLPFGVTISTTVPQGSEIPEGLMNNPVLVSPWAPNQPANQMAPTSVSLESKSVGSVMPTTL